MECPCCQNEMTLIRSHVATGTSDFEGRTYDVFICEYRSQWCNGLIAKHDVFDQKVTFVTPGHTNTTLHLNFINSVSKDDLLKAVFTTYEWCAYKGIE
ncbi:hypothetical protein ST201phi2-1p142 [Pseudomonas phage 201phi2-1]|uniref:Uncharacterized protein n=1 Tax=Pseudomonas phage 201phi2-1 TaxID=198110 RepID=B3FJ05_BP201|nr:hypothetical protein ST201phi2-1p142 [Pseudomonas phage 201phi2-1]ABY62973.1 hypothetical protein 201phi2-1p142 [Pseudomonas phage 201phi2-1]